MYRSQQASRSQHNNRGGRTKPVSALPAPQAPPLTVPISLEFITARRDIFGWTSFALRRCCRAEFSCSAALRGLRAGPVFVAAGVVVAGAWTCVALQGGCSPRLGTSTITTNGRADMMKCRPLDLTQYAPPDAGGRSNHHSAHTTCCPSSRGDRQIQTCAARNSSEMRARQGAFVCSRPHRLHAPAAGMRPGSISARDPSCARLVAISCALV